MQRYLFLIWLIIVCNSTNGSVCIKYKYELSEREKVIFLFSTFYISKKDGYLGYNELELFQRLTDPQLPLNTLTYRYIIKLLGGNLRDGLNIEQFNSSYYRYKHTLGTDLHKDYTIITRIIDNVM